MKAVVALLLLPLLLVFPQLAAQAHGAAVSAPAASDEAPSRGFTHPGVLVNRGQLDFVKRRVAARREPWFSAFNNAKTSKYGSLHWVAHPRSVVECGGQSIPNIGCSDERGDATAAYTQALLWYYSGDRAYARKAIEIMNAWSAVLRDHTNSNAPLQAAWAAEKVVRAAEIIRHTSTEWAVADVQRFETMLNNVYVREFNDPANAAVYAMRAGNWHLAAIDATLGIAVFTDNRALFKRALNDWRARVPAYVYLRSDNGGNGLPIPPPGGEKDAPAQLSCFWLRGAPGCESVKDLHFEDGHAQETCRDLGHTEMGLASLINVAETAHLQGVNLYGKQRKRIVAGLEYNTRFLNGAGYPRGFCHNSPTLQRPTDTPRSFEIAYNHYAIRLGVALPNTKVTIERMRRGGGAGPSTLPMAWETLTHGDTGNADASR